MREPMDLPASTTGRASPCTLRASDSAWRWAATSTGWRSGVLRPSFMYG
jgi:hypothetical protein